MEKKYLKKVLAGLGIAGLVTSCQGMGTIADGASG
jgi:radical SAM modification target selenobiotic family peptide